MNRKQAARMAAKNAVRRIEKTKREKEADAVYARLNQELEKAGISSDWLKRYLKDTVVVPIVDNFNKRIDEEVHRAEMDTWITAIGAAMLSVRQITSKTKDGRPTKNRWGQGRCMDLAATMYENLMGCISQPELIETVYDELAIRIDPTDPLEPISRVKKGEKNAQQSL